MSSKDNTYIIGKSGKLMKFDAHKIPEIKETENKNYAIYGTSKEWRNKQPQYYNYLYNSSSKHGAIINTKNRFIIGDGLTYNAKGKSLEEKIKAGTFVNKIEADQIFNKISLDRAIQGGFCVEVIPSNDGKQISIHHIEFSNVRVSKREYDENGREAAKTFFYTNDWNYNPEQNKDYTIFEQFSFDMELLDSNKRYLFYYKDYNPDDRIYPMPEFIGGVPYIAADVEVGNFVFNNVENGFTAGLLVNFFNGDPSPEQMAEIQERWDIRNHGSDNAGKPIMSFNELDSKGVEVTPITSNGQDDRYIQLNQQIRDEIFTSHEIDPILVFGQTGEGGMSNDAGEKRVAYEYFKSSYVKPKQRVFEMFFNAVAQFNGYSFDLEIKELEQIKPEFSEAAILQVLSRDEVRLMMGYKPLENPLKFKEVNEWDSFASCGISNDSFEVIESQEIPLFNVQDAEDKANKFRSEFATRKEISVLNLLIDGLTPKEIKDSIQIKTPEYNKIINNLKDEGLFDNDGVTSKGQDLAIKETSFIVYKYVTRPDAPALRSESRDFCKNMLRLSQTTSWTLQDIQDISAREGRDVFADRGGWYTNPNTGVSQPFCRHYWRQSLVRLK